MLRSLINRVSSKSPFISLIRNYSDESSKWLAYERRQFVRRYGYEPKIHLKGPLPRIINDSGPISCFNFETKKHWHKTESLFGQNDYIDILGDGSIHPKRLLDNMPAWLRGLKGQGNYKAIESININMRRHATPFMKTSRPTKYREMKQRANFLYRKLNLKTKPPDYEGYY